MQQMVFNRIDDEVINWNYVESVLYSPEKDALIIYFTSGNYKEIKDVKSIENLKDMFNIFPDINNDESRNAMKTATINQNPSRQKKTSTGPKTDIQGEVG